MDIVLGYGFDNIYFGLLEQEIIKRLGVPDKKYESDYDLHFQYFPLRCDLWFRKEDIRLHWIECSHPEIRIYDELIINKSKEELIAFFKSKLHDKLEINDYDSFESYYFDNNCFELQFEFDLLTQIGFGHFWSDLDEPIWQSS